ncbi:MAG TPA: polysaccharide deacetylase family protein [Bacillota bacterium]|nr:polysaccharide deacetylase family protein [Bacillota bacterium]
MKKHSDDDFPMDYLSSQGNNDAYPYSGQDMPYQGQSAPNLSIPQTDDSERSFDALPNEPEDASTYSSFEQTQMPYDTQSNLGGQAPYDTQSNYEAQSPYESQPSYGEQSYYENVPLMNTQQQEIPNYEQNQAPTPKKKTLNDQINALKTMLLSFVAVTMILLCGMVYLITIQPSKGDAKVTKSSTTTATSGTQNAVVSDSSDSSLTTDSTAATSDTAPQTTYPAGTKLIALTFDDGPAVSYTTRVLDALEEKDAVATFFLLGQRIENTDAAFLQRMIDTGSEIGNHSYDHTNYGTLTSEQVRDQLARTDQALMDKVGVQTTVLRPPQGSTQDELFVYSTERGIPVVNWSSNSCPQDWVAENQSAEYIANFVIENARNGDIVLLHDIRDCTVDAIPAMIDGLRAAGFELVTVTELLEAQAGGFEPGVLYCNATL